MLGGGVSHPSQLTTGLVIKSVTTSPTLAGEHMLFILQVSILSEQCVIIYARRLAEKNKNSSATCSLNRTTRNNKYDIIVTVNNKTKSKRINVYTHPECTSKRKKIYPYMKSPSTNATTKEHSSETKSSRLTITLETQCDDHQREFNRRFRRRRHRRNLGRKPRLV